MNATSPRDETFAVEDGYLVRRAVPRCGKPYIHRCPLGASWEGFLLQQVVEHLGAAWEECFFWATHSGAELDLLWVRGRRRWGFEFKRTSSPRLTGSLRTAIETLRLQKAFLVYAGYKTFPKHKRVSVVAASRVLEDVCA